MKSHLPIILVVCSLLLLYGCGGGGGGGGGGDTGDVTYSITGSIELPNDISATMTAAIRQQQLPANISIVFVSPDGTRIPGEITNGKNFVIAGVPACSNREIQVVSASGKILLIRLLSVVNGDLEGINLNTRSTALTYYIRQLATPHAYEDIDAKATQGALDLSQVETAINNWLTGKTDIDVADVASAVTQIVPVEVIDSGLAEILNRPKVSIRVSATNPTSSSPISVNITFSSAVTDFELADINVTNGTASDLIHDPVDLKLWTVQVTPATAGIVSISIPENAVKDSANNGNLAAEPISFVYDNAKPTIAIATTAPNPTNVSPIPVSITFSEAVTGFELADIKVTNGAPSDLQQDPVNSKLWSVKITPTTAGAVSVSIPENAVKDSANNGNLSSTALAIAFDNIRPTISMTASLNPTSAEPVLVSISFSKAITGFELADIVVVNGVSSELQQGPVDSKLWTVKVTPTAAGDVSVSIPENSVKDSANNGNLAPNILTLPDEQINIPPVVEITTPANNSSQYIGQALIITATASDVDGTIIRVEFYQNSIKVGEATSAPFVYTMPANSMGSYSFTAKAMDNNGVETVSTPVAFSVQTKTKVGGIINADQTWSLASSPYEITNTIQVAYGSTLTVEPGVSIIGGNIEVWGTLKANGSPNNNITFIALRLTGKHQNNSENFIQLSYSNLTDTVIDTWNGPGNIEITNCILKRTQNTPINDGMGLSFGSGFSKIEKNIFINYGSITIGESPRLAFRNNVLYNSGPLSSFSSYFKAELNSFIQTKDKQIALEKQLTLSNWWSSRMVATNNYWSIPIDTNIEDLIFDKNDDLGCIDYIQYQPTLTQPDPSTPDPTPYL